MAPRKRTIDKLKPEGVGGVVKVAECFFHRDTKAFGAFVVQTAVGHGTRLFKTYTTRSADEINRLLPRLADADKNGEVIYSETLLRCKEHPQSFVVEAAARKMLKRLVQEEVGGVDGWETVYNGVLCIENLEGRETVSPFGEPVAEATAELADDNPFGGSTDDFAARRRAKRRRRKQKMQEKVENEVLADDGKTKLRAFHSSSHAKEAKAASAVALVEVFALGEIYGDGTEPVLATGRILNNNNMYATIVANVPQDSEILSKSLIWYFGDDEHGAPSGPPIYIGTSEAINNQEHGGSNV